VDPGGNTSTRVGVMEDGRKKAARILVEWIFNQPHNRPADRQ
jgi:hypothetical protein